jgi:amino acid transporter
MSFHYEGFRIITHTAEVSLIEEQGNLSRAIYISIAITMVVYTALAITVFGLTGE